MPHKEIQLCLAVLILQETFAFQHKPNSQLIFEDIQLHHRINPPTLTEAGLNSTSFLGSGSAGFGAGLGSSFFGSAFLGSGFLGAMADLGRRGREGGKGRKEELLQEKSQAGVGLYPLWKCRIVPPRPVTCRRSQWGHGYKRTRLAPAILDPALGSSIVPN